ncbi:unnamed protein product [Ilex paraguariensis]|uniref:Uncharacterized protein n=1 Tax=Ilex paraguariensis TaxID=185542 RepID=A0ABC8S7G9_9AQUA
MVDSGEIALSTPLRRWKSFVETRPWLVVSEAGKSYVEEVGKHAIMRRTRVSARDLRILDPKLSYTATILGRQKAIVVNLESIRAIITANETLILNPMDPSVSPFVRDLELKLSSFDGSKAIAVEKCDKGVKGEASDGSLMNTSKMGSSKLLLPFEFRVLEICLTFVCDGLEFEVCVPNFM